jgi:flagellar hook-basal body complex protein FliE
MTAAAIPPVAATALDALSLPGGLPAAVPANAASFGDMLMQGVQSVDRRVANADSMVRAFALNGDVPIHQVTFALEEARLSLELMMQVRARLVESYQRMMEMQL